MAGSRKVDPRHGHYSQRPSPAQHGITQQMKGLSLDNTPTGQGYHYEQVPAYQYAPPAEFGSRYASAQPASYQPASYQSSSYWPGTVPPPQTATPPSYKYGPTQADFAAAEKLLYALEKSGKLPPFKPKKFGKWIHDKLQQSSRQRSSAAAPQQYPSAKQYSSAQAPRPKRAPARYRCDCGNSYGGDSYARDELDRHLNRHRSHRRDR